MSVPTEQGGVTGAELPLSMRAYARRRGTSAVAVLRAIRRGRLKACLVLDEKGKAKIADPVLADAEWEANTDLSRAPGYVKERAATRRTEQQAEPPETDGRGDGPLSLTEASAQEKGWKAKLAELDYRKKSGELVELSEVAARDRKLMARLSEQFQQCRTKILAVPSRAKAAIPHLTATDVRTIDALLREALEALAAQAESAA